jgi:HPt (histidine-containing phosphotransfer) domain-containing protein
MHQAGDLEAALAAMWADARPRLLARVSVLESAAAGALSPADRACAAQEAHTLAGTLGSFGRADGAAAARSAERAIEAADGAALAVAAPELRAVVES